MANHAKTGKNQNINLRMPKKPKKMLERIGSPPPAGSKNVVPKFLSVSNIVIAPAKTGRDKSNKKAVTKTDHTKSGILCMVIPGVLIFNIVVMKLIAPSIEETPAR
jgi:hypothetical protein